MIKEKHVVPVIIILVLFFIIVAGLILFVIPAPEKYLGMLIFAPVSWLVIKWLPIKRKIN